jgi:hypothetical protein
MRNTLNAFLILFVGFIAVAIIAGAAYALGIN